MSLNKAELPKVDSEFEEITAGEEEDRQQKLKTKWAALEALVGNENRIRLSAEDLVQRFERRLEAMDGKAMVVCMSRRICVDLYNELIKLRPDWASVPDDDSEAEKKQSTVVKIVMTDFDAPCLHTMYADKPVRGHGLMQAIARVNRVFRDKQGGLIVDYLGLADPLADTLATYTKAGGTGKAVEQVQDEAVPAMLATFEKLQSFFHGCAYEEALVAEPQGVLSVHLAAVDHAFAQSDGWKRLRTLVKQLSAAFALAVPRPETENVVDHLAFFQRVVAMICKQ